MSRWIVASPQSISRQAVSFPLPGAPLRFVLRLLLLLQGKSQEATSMGSPFFFLSFCTLDFIFQPLEEAGKSP
jgi:hypothetical protein